jgi:glycosyltransferase involved in cell wall biosynthesis
MVVPVSGNQTIPGLVSVIMPFFNTREEFLLEAIESIQGQTYNHWELMLVDDGSEPSTSNVARRLAGQHAEQIK